MLVISRVKLSHSNHLILRENVVDALTAFMAFLALKMFREFFPWPFFPQSSFFRECPSRTTVCFLEQSVLNYWANIRPYIFLRPIKIIVEFRNSYI